MINAQLYVRVATHLSRERLRYRTDDRVDGSDDVKLWNVRSVVNVRQSVLVDHELVDFRRGQQAGVRLEAVRKTD